MFSEPGWLVFLTGGGVDTGLDGYGVLLTPNLSASGRHVALTLLLLAQPVPRVLDGARCVCWVCVWVPLDCGGGHGRCHAFFTPHTSAHTRGSPQRPLSKVVVLLPT